MERIGLFAGEVGPDAVGGSARVDGDVGGVGTEAHQGHHRPEVVCGAEIADGVAVIRPLTHLPGIAHGLRPQTALQLEQHPLPAQPAERAEGGGVEPFARADGEGCEAAEEGRVCLGGRIRLHEPVCRIEKLLRAHGQHLLHRDKIVLRGIASFRQSIQPGGVGRQRHQPHPALDGGDIREVVLPGKHDARDGPDRPGGDVDALDALGQRALPAGISDGVSACLFQHSGGVRPCVQHLNIEKAVNFRHNINLRLGADVQPCLRVDGVHIRRDDGAGGSICQLPGMDELVDGGAGAGRCSGVGRDLSGGVHEHQRESVEVCFLEQILHPGGSGGLFRRQKGDAAGDSSGRGKL